MMSEKQPGGPPPEGGANAPPEYPSEPPPPYSGTYPQVPPEAPGYPAADPSKQYGGQPQPQPGYQPMGPTHTTTTVVITQPTLGPLPISMMCPKCQAQIVTETTPVAGTLAWLICILLSVFGLWCGCCLIPFCVDDCQDVEHRCPNCKNFLGSYRRM